MVCRYTSDCRYIYNIRCSPFPTIPLLFIYQPKTIDIAIALPVDAFAFSSVAISVDPPPTLILMDEYAVKIPTVLIPVADEALILPVTLPVTSPVTPPTTSPVKFPEHYPLHYQSKHH